MDCEARSPCSFESTIGWLVTNTSPNMQNVSASKAAAPIHRKRIERLASSVGEGRKTCRLHTRIGRHLPSLVDGVARHGMTCDYAAGVLHKGGGIDSESSADPRRADDRVSRFAPQHRGVAEHGGARRDGRAY